MAERQESIAVIGLGYVGLPLAIGLARSFNNVLGYDISPRRIDELQSGHDRTKEVEDEDVQATTMRFTSNSDDLAGHTFFIVTVPTPVLSNKQPDLSILIAASHEIGKHLKPGGVVVYESTVFPGATEDICGPALEEASGLKCGVDFKLAYSPERINPSDKVHTLENVIKVVAGQDEDTLARVVKVYDKVVKAGLHQAPSIKVAESAKVIENVQRDLNIALMNELALIFDRMDIRTADVLAAAGTKWNFLPFVPGLVGGHCIGVDPYYLTAKAESLGYHPEIILAGRRINDSMGRHVAQRTVKMLIDSDRPVKHARVGVLGLSFKENVPDLRNSRVPDIIDELRSFGIKPLIHDPLINPDEAEMEYGLSLVDWDQMKDLDALILAVNHKEYVEQPASEMFGLLQSGGVMIDVKTMFAPEDIPEGYEYWCL